MPDLALINRASGEILDAVTARALLAAAGIDDPRDAATVELAAFVDNARGLRSITDEARGVVSDELLRRMDLDGCWTWRDGGYEVKAPSPEAGTTAYHTGLLREALQRLVAECVISPQASSSAVERVVATVDVSYDLLRSLLACCVLGDPDNEAVDDLRKLLAAEPDPTYRQHAAGIRSLCKIPAARATIEACRLPATPPPRAARVRRIAA
jgi:hypothetical protein